MLAPRPYQIEGRDFLAGRRHALLADEMRVGKTPQAILAAQQIRASRILVLCPAIAVPQWQSEFRRWWLVGDPDAQIMPQLTVLSYGMAERHREELRSREWDLLIPDECHYAGNPTAKRTGLVYGKTGVGWRAHRIWALSGTPAPKSAASLWPMLRAFGVTGMAYEDFLTRYCTLRPMSWVPTGTKTAMIPELKAMLATVMLRRTRRQVRPDMPDIGFSFLSVKPEVSARYVVPPRMTDDALLEWLAVNEHANREDRVEVALAKAGPLAEEIAFALNNGLLKQTVVFGWHIAPLEWLAGTLNARGLRAAAITGKTPRGERERIQSEFRAGRLDVVCANILAAGTAIDLSAARHGYFLELDWVPGNNVQAANRLVSLDRSEAVTFDVVTWPGSADDRVQKVLLTRVAQLAKLV